VGVDIASLSESLVAAGLPVVGVANCTHEARAAHVAAQDPVLWFSLADADVRLDLSRGLTAEEYMRAEDVVAVWVLGL
jgi:hypothetical protein